MIDTIGELVPVGGKLLYLPPSIIPGITAADALDANDQMGTLFSLAVPRNGVIVKATFLDLDDEGISKELWIFNKDVTLAANDAAFSLADDDLHSVVDVLTFVNFKDAVNGQVSVSTDTPCWYTASRRQLFFGVKTLGADNIAAGSMPRISLLIERYADD